MSDAVSEPMGMPVLEARIVRYRDLRPCTNAFIDTRSPGSEAKENFTIIGPGVSENPEQYVHIPEPHGFNIGGARQPPGCVNSQHSHETAEVFVVHTGVWRFDLGEHGDDAQVVLGPGDTISLPVRMFRGFTNVGTETGFLFAVLGGDDPGRVTWAPKVFEMARSYGLVLLENGRLVDTAKGESVPDDIAPMTPTTAADVAALRRVTPDVAETFVVRASGPQGRVIGRNAPLNWPHGFTLDRIDLAARIERPVASAEVVFVHRGSIRLSSAAGETVLNEGDTITWPAGMTVVQTSDTGATIFRVASAPD